MDPSEIAAYERSALFHAQEYGHAEGGETLQHVIRGLKTVCFFGSSKYGFAAHNLLSRIEVDERHLYPLELSMPTQDEWYLTRLLETVDNVQLHDYGF
jgi:hypothetical protein